MERDLTTIERIENIGELIEVKELCEHLEQFGDRYGSDLICWRLSGLLSETPGYCDLRDLAADEFGAEWLKRKRAELAVTQHKLPSEINSLSILEFAKTILATDTRNDGKSSRRRSPPENKSLMIISAMNAWHKYENGSCLNFEPFALNKFAKSNEIKPATLSDFLKANFGGHKEYCQACIGQTQLVAKLIILNGDTKAVGERELLGDPESD